MNATIELMHKHGSVRQYKSDPVQPDLIETIVRAGQRASTSSNLQMYSVVAVQDAAKRARLGELCGNQKHIPQAPVFLAWCADLSRLERVSAMRGYEHGMETVENFLLAAMDAAIMMQNAALAAESLGLGFCFIGGIRNNPQEVIDLLGLPHLTVAVSGMTLGWPEQPPLVRPRLPLEAVLHWEQYDSSNEAQHLAAYDAEMIATGIYGRRQVQKPGTTAMEPEDYGWTEHSARRVSTPPRPGLRAVLESQGFLLK